MSGRTWSRAAVLALALALPAVPAGTSAATAGPTGAVHVAKHGDDDRKPGESGRDKSDRGKSDGKGKKKQKGKDKKDKKPRAKAKFNLGGRLTAVDAEAGTVTFRVHGGKLKAVRGQELTVTVADGARVRRNDAAASLTDFQPGDKVRAKGVRAGDAWTANRVQAEAPGFADDHGSDDD
ncbi:hypothetical protein [Sporichthya polymorpha]|uniref:hypothetical protein n=1 Tax=Sporichthya polymorpha TaxID=35751 RepID=UPI00037593FF|nr:hypothetical protein [Sporichthya polymorpha]